MITLDTHILIWWLGDSQRLSAKAKRLIEQERKLLGWGLIALFAAMAMATYLYNRTEKKTE